jgi:hypothetical protein
MTARVITRFWLPTISALLTVMSANSQTPPNPERQDMVPPDESQAALARGGDSKAGVLKSGDPPSQAVPVRGMPLTLRSRTGRNSIARWVA